MIVALQVGRPTRIWHLRLAARLEAAGHDVRFRVVPTSVPRKGAVVLAIEGALYGSRCAGFASTATPKTDDRIADLCLVLAGTPPVDVRTLAPCFDEAPGEAAMLATLLVGHAPVIEVREGAVAYAIGRPANENPLRLSRALEGVLRRLETLLVQAVAAWAADRPAVGRLGAATVTSPGAPILWHGVRGKLTRLFGALGAQRGRPDHWRIEVRALVGRGMIADGSWRDSRTIADDGTRFYADPFPFEDQARRFVFFEDFPYLSGKGVIGMVEIDDDLVASAPRTVLEQPVHLSYPLVIREGAHIYMLPEMSTARRLQLFRADPFPDRWVPDAVLLEGVVLSDATIVRHEDRFWLFAALSDGTDSTWDQLGLFHAPSLFGPWVAHSLNPVLIDASAARPAGAMWCEDGCLMRVAQDCRSGYGSGLAVCRVERLDTDGYVQSVVRRISPPRGSDAVGIHTWNRSGSLEVIDLRGPHLRH